ncbi:MAG: hypothetical protein WC399_01750 [Bacilli bacterium]|jgi:hypothetical protein
MNERQIKRKMKREADRLVPDVLSSVYARLDLEKPQTKRPSAPWKWGMVTAGAMGALVLALVLPSLLPGPIVSEAEAYVRLKYVAASLIEAEEPEPAVEINYLPTTDATPIFAYKVSQRGKTMTLDDKQNNALYAENEASKIIAGGLGLRNSIKKDPVALAVSLTNLARQAGYLESYAKGNVVAYSVTSADATYQDKIKNELQTAIDDYFREQLIYGIAYEDAELEAPDFSGYEDFADEIDSYRQQFDFRRHQHDDDDKQRGSNWGEDLDEWMDDHRGNHGQPGSSSGSSSETGGSHHHDSGQNNTN